MTKLHMQKNSKPFIFSKLILTLMGLALAVQNSQASMTNASNIDIYRSKQITVEQIEAQYGKELNEISSLLSSSNDINSPKNETQIYKDMTTVIDGINKMGKFSYVYLTPVRYPGNPVTYITIDVVDKKDKKRLAHFLPKPKEDIPDPDHLISQWIEYQKLGNSLMFKKNPPKFKSCPAYHCLFGFEDPALKKYQDIFTENTEKDKLQLMNVLKNDKDENKRAAAVFVLAHIKNGNELIRDITPFIYDPSIPVRNNVMRVLAQALLKTTVADFPVKDIILALDFPSADDRNKALYVLTSLINQPVYAAYVKRHARKDLLANLKMQQPNIHDMAYQILQKISDKNYGDRDYQAWDKWCKAKKKRKLV